MINITRVGRVGFHPINCFCLTYRLCDNCCKVYGNDRNKYCGSGCGNPHCDHCNHCYACGNGIVLIIDDVCEPSPLVYKQKEKSIKDLEEKIEFLEKEVITMKLELDRARMSIDGVGRVNDDTGKWWREKSAAQKAWWLDTLAKRIKKV